MAKKVALLKKKLGIWARTCFGSIKLKKLALLSDLNAIDVAKESNQLGVAGLAKEQDLLLELGVFQDRRRFIGDSGLE